MRLQAGTKLAHYEILAPLGAGGMGEWSTERRCAAGPTPDLRPRPSGGGTADHSDATARCEEVMLMDGFSAATDQRIMNTILPDGYARLAGSGEGRGVKRIAGAGRGGSVFAG